MSQGTPQSTPFTGVSAAFPLGGRASFRCHWPWAGRSFNAPFSTAPPPSSTCPPLLTPGCCSLMQYLGVLGPLVGQRRQARFGAQTAAWSRDAASSWLHPPLTTFSFVACCCCCLKSFQQGSLFRSSSTSFLWFLRLQWKPGAGGTVSVTLSTVACPVIVSSVMPSTSESQWDCFFPHGICEIPFSQTHPSALPALWGSKSPWGPSAPPYPPGRDQSKLGRRVWMGLS